MTTKKTETVTTVVKTTVVEPVVQQVKKWDARSFEPLLCCPPKFHAIYVQMSKLDKTELRQFRDDLRSFTGMNRLHSILEKEFDEALKDETSNTED